MTYGLLVSGLGAVGEPAIKSVAFIIMICRPVLIQLLPSVGAVANGSVLLASEPPLSMYIRPTLPFGGSFLLIQAMTHSSELASPHQGSSPGVAGSFGMHQKPLFPSRNVFMEPSACGA